MPEKPPDRSWVTTEPVTGPEAPEPSRSGISYVCGVGGDHWAENACGRRFIFRSSYQQHWEAEHFVKPLPVVDGKPGPGQCTCPDRHAEMGEKGPEPVVWTERDRKEATARLDAYLEPRTIKALGPIRLVQLDETGQPKMDGQRILGQWVDEAIEVPPPGATVTLPGMEPVTLRIPAGTYVWDDIEQAYGPIGALAHHVEVTPCPCGWRGCQIAHHHCTVCDITTLVPPPLPCPGPRKDT